MNKYYDYIIVGAGLFGLTCARLLTDRAYKCLVIDKRDHIGGNCYTENIFGINVHKYGPHIFHTNSKEIWDFVNKYTDFNNFSCRPKLMYGDCIYSFPVNLMTMHQLWGVKTPEEAKNKIESETVVYKEKYPNPKSAYEFAMQSVGPTIYNIFYRGYLKKQWNKDPKEIPASVIQRQTFRLYFDDNYYYDIYQGIPDYNKLFNNLINGIDNKNEIDYLKNRDYFNKISNNIIYTGQIDRFFNYKFGKLEYRSLKFEEEMLPIEDYQGTFMMSYPEEKYDFTRIIEHKHFEFKKQEHTVITREYPSDWNIEKEPYYPVNDEKNDKIYNAYLKISNSESNIYFGGRMGTYKYINMDQTIYNAIELVKKIINEK